METKKILVVDDEKGICENVHKILAKKNYEVTQALSAQEALEKMAKESFSLLISDIVMPQKNGLELLKLVKEQWPLTKVIIMTAYASTDTAMKAMRLGALDYLPKPFTPKEVRETVEKALSGELHEAPVSEKERKAIDVIDLDIPFDRQEVATAAGEKYVDSLGPSDMPVVEIPSPETLEYYCKVGKKVCDIYKKLGNTCKAGLKTDACPQAKKGAKGKEEGKSQKASDPKKLVGIDQPFSYDEVASITGPEYLMNLQNDGIAFVPYEELKKNMSAMMAEKRKVIDVDIPFARDEVAKQAGESYVDTLGPSDMPAVSAPAPETLEFYCKVGLKVCDIYKKLGNTCKAGLKTDECPQAKKGAKAKKEGKGEKALDPKKLVGIDQPFSYEGVASITGPEYLMNFQSDGIAFVPYEELKRNVSALLAEKRKVIDVDIPFARDEVAKQAGESYADTLGPSDMPSVSAPAPETLEFYCKVGLKVCDIYKKLGNTCKAGLKTNECPQMKGKKKAAGAKSEVPDVRKWIGPEMPFSFEEVVAHTGPEFVKYLEHEGVTLMPYEELKQRVSGLLKKEAPPKAVVHELPRKVAEHDVLVIDDEAAVNNNIRRILSKKGFSVDQAMTKEEAIQRIEAKPYRLVLLDLKIPGVQGLELLHAIREKSPETLVIIITGYASIETAKESARLGAVDYVPKPFTPDEIRKVTENAIRLAA